MENEIFRQMSCRSLRGNVDRNIPVCEAMLDLGVVPYVGTWIEMRIDEQWLWKP